MNSSRDVKEKFLWDVETVQGGSWTSRSLWAWNESKRVNNSQDMKEKFSRDVETVQGGLWTSRSLWAWNESKWANSSWEEKVKFSWDVWAGGNEYHVAFGRDKGRASWWIVHDTRRANSRQMWTPLLTQDSFPYRFAVRLRNELAPVWFVLVWDFVLASCKLSQNRKREPVRSHTGREGIGKGRGREITCQALVLPNPLETPQASLLAG